MGVKTTYNGGTCVAPMHSENCSVQVGTLSVMGKETHCMEKLVTVCARIDVLQG